MLPTRAPILDPTAGGPTEVAGDDHARTGLAELAALLANGAPDRAAIAALIDGHPGERDAMIALLHQQLGNAALADAFAPPQPEAAIAAPLDAPVAAPAGGELGARLSDTTSGELDVPGAEAYNRAHIVDVVRFDRATHGQFARGDGQLDAARIAAWQTAHHLPADGRVTENTCLVAEGKPPIPEPVPASADPTIEILHPGGEMYPPGFPVPLTLRVACAPGATLHLSWTVREAAGAPPIEQHEQDVVVGGDGHAILDLRTGRLGEARQIRGFFVEVQGSTGGAAVDANAAFSVGAPFGELIPDVLPDDPPPLPAPQPVVQPIDQAAAEAWNRAHVPLVVRFDRATHGYFAKPNGELDALAVAEYQREHGHAVTGMVDEDTAQIAEAHGGGLSPGPTPGPGPGPDPANDATAHGPPQLWLVQPFAVIEPFQPIMVQTLARPGMEIQMSWSLNSTIMGERGRGMTVATVGEGGLVMLRDTWFPLGGAVDEYEPGVLEIAVATPMGAAPLLVQPITIHTPPGFGEVLAARGGAPGPTADPGDDDPPAERS